MVLIRLSMDYNRLVRSSTDQYGCKPTTIVRSVIIFLTCYKYLRTYRY